MAVRTAKAWVNGDILSGTDIMKLPGGWIGHAEVTASQSSIAAIVDLTSLTVTVTVGTSRKIRIHGNVGFASTVSTDTASLYITDGSNTVLTQTWIECTFGLTAPVRAMATVVVNASSGSNTWKLRADRAGAGSVSMEATSARPAFILVEDLGPQ